jgi:uncharacterized protein (DUF1778 family)
MAATARLEFRVQPEGKARLELAANLVHVPLSDFVRSAAEDRAEQVLSEHEVLTRVPAEFFDDLYAALDAPAEANSNLARAAKRARDVVVARS